MKTITAIAVATLLMLAGCAAPALENLGNIGKESDPARFYTLRATLDENARTQAALPHLVLGVGPVSIADYLDRSQIVVREADTRLELAEFDRWAGNPGKEIQRVMVANLAAALGTERIVGYPWKSGVAPQLTVELMVERFEYTQDGQVLMAAGWQVYGDSGRSIVAFRRSLLQQPAARDYTAIAAGLSALLGELAQEIALTLRQTQPR